MAYLAFDELGTIRQGDLGIDTRGIDTSGIDAARARLSPLEWAVVVLARGDRLASLRTPGRLAVAMGTLFGGAKSNTRLADPRLEALRRIAVLAWHDRFAVPAHEIDDFLVAGFTAGQYRTLLASIRMASLNGKRHA